MEPNLTALYLKSLQAERAWWHVRREFYAGVAKLTKAELVELWESEWQDATIGHFQNTSVYPDAFTAIEYKENIHRYKWQQNVNQRKYDILRRARDAGKRKVQPSRGVEVATSAAASGDILINPVNDDPSQTVDKMLSLYTRLPTEAQREFQLRFNRLVRDMAGVA